MKRLGLAFICTLGLGFGQVGIRQTFILPQATALGFSNNGTSLVTIKLDKYDYRNPQRLFPVSLYDITQGGQLNPIYTRQFTLQPLAVRPDTPIIAEIEGGICKYNTPYNEYISDTPGKIRLTDLASSEILSEWQGSGLCMTTGRYFGLNGKTLVLTSRLGYVQVWEVASKQRLYTLLLSDSRIDQAKVSFDGQKVAVCDGFSGVAVFRIADGKVLARIRFKWLANVSTTCVSGGLAFTPDDEQLVLADGYSPVGIWSLRTGRLVQVLRRQTDQNGRVRGPKSVAVTADGKYVAVTDAGQTLTVFSLKTGAVLAKRYNAGISLLASPTKSLLVTHKASSYEDQDLLIGWEIR